MNFKKGFTLVELLIVIIIIGILAAVAIPQFASSTDDARQASLDTNLARIRTAIDLYFAEHGSYPGANAAGGAFGAAGSEAAFISQLTLFTKDDGTVATSFTNNTFENGPYLKKGVIPKQPLDNVATVTVVNTATLPLTGTNATATGWKYSTATGQFVTNDTDFDAR